MVMAVVAKRPLTLRESFSWIPPHRPYPPQSIGPRPPSGTVDEGEATTLPATCTREKT